MGNPLPQTGIQASLSLLSRSTSHAPIRYRSDTDLAVQPPVYNGPGVGEHSRLNSRHDYTPGTPYRSEGVVMKQPADSSSGVYARARQGFGSGVAARGIQEPAYRGPLPASTSEMAALEAWAVSEATRPSSDDHLSDAEMKQWQKHAIHMMDVNGDGCVQPQEVRDFFQK